jgi:membrane protein implicated in regulation of membrane protease activity
VQALAQQALESHQAGYSIVLVFFAVHLVLLAVLLVTADAFPGWLGILMLVAGAAYLVDGATLVLAPELRTTLNPYLTVPMSFELVLAGWMLVRGVRPTRWCGDRAVDGLPLFYRKEAS